MTSSPDFKLTWLWRHAFVNPQADITVQEQEYFRDRYLFMREKTAVLASRIVIDLPGFTVHDVSHLDALWETASIVAEGAITLNPAEAFIFGAAVLLHDAAMSVAAFPNGLLDIKKTVVWKDTVARLCNSEGQNEACEDVTPDVLKLVVPEVLRRLHAEQSAELAGQAWISSNGEPIFLIDDGELRQFYSSTIGQIANSHWWPISRIEHELRGDLGAFSPRTRSKIDRVKLACLLRIADGIHLDQRRAPRFLRSLLNPAGTSALHWDFQEKLATPHVELDSIVFTAGAPFTLKEADSWWLAYDTISNVDRELREVDLLLQGRSRELLKARRVKGVGAPEQFARTIPTRDWRPVDTQLRVSDIPKIIETLGGAKLYGEDPTVVLRELIQNSSDAIQARRRLQNREDSWGAITISLNERDAQHWLFIEDNGVGMSEHVLTGPLIDFGTSFWKSTLAAEEFPGLLANGMRAIGHFGIGFFSVFMLGSLVRVISRRYDRAEDAARVLEFRDGTLSRPILYSADPGISPLDGGTRIEILLKADPKTKEGLLGTQFDLAQLVGSLAPNIETAIRTKDTGGYIPVVAAGDWIDLQESLLLQRIDPSRKTSDSSIQKPQLMRCIKDDSGRVYGRAFINPNLYTYSRGGYVTVGGLRATKLANIQGVLIGECLTAARDSALPTVGPEILAAWASEQADLIGASNFPEEYKAKCAEVVMECGGNISRLPIACWGGEWFDELTLKAKVTSLQEIMVSFDGEITYDENIDSVHPREFRSDFEINNDVLLVPKHNGSVLSIKRQKWPSMITGTDNSQVSNLTILVLDIIKNFFRPSAEEVFEREVGTVNGTAICREVTVFSRDDSGVILQSLTLPQNKNAFYDLF